MHFLLRTIKSFQEVLDAIRRYVCLRKSFPGETANAVEIHNPADLASVRTGTKPFFKTDRICLLSRITRLCEILITG